MGPFALWFSALFTARHTPLATLVALRVPLQPATQPSASTLHPTAPGRKQRWRRQRSLHHERQRLPSIGRLRVRWCSGALRQLPCAAAAPRGCDPGGTAAVAVLRRPFRSRVQRDCGTVDENGSGRPAVRHAGCLSNRHGGVRQVPGVDSVWTFCIELRARIRPPLQEAQYNLLHTV